MKSGMLIIGMLAMWRDVDYLLMANPVAFNHLRIRRDCEAPVLKRLLPVVGSSL